MRSFGSWVALFALILGALACGPGVVQLKPAQSCDGGKIDDCRARCDQNQGRACYRLGWFYEEGEVVAENFNQALKLYDRACDANWAIACRALGEIYWNGKKRKRDRKKGISYFTKACSLGLDVACPSRMEIAVSEGKSPAEAFSVNVDTSGVNTPDGPKAPRPDAPSAPTPDMPSAPTPNVPSTPSPSIP